MSLLFWKIQKKNKLERAELQKVTENMNTVDENRVAKKKQSGKIRKKGQIDWMITLLPLGLIAALSILFFLLNLPSRLQILP